MAGLSVVGVCDLRVGIQSLVFVDDSSLASLMVFYTPALQLAARPVPRAVDCVVVHLRAGALE